MKTTPPSPRALALVQAEREAAEDRARQRAIAAKLELARARHHLRRLRASSPSVPAHLSAPPPTKVKGTMHTDTPSELVEQSDGVSDDGALGQQIIGACRCDSPAVAGLPSYLFTRANLSHPVVRRRLAANIQAMTPKLRRRVVARLKAAIASSRSRVGSVVNVYPSVAGGGWSGISVSGGRSRGGCPYANVAGALTP